jgi:hypothetical protein
MKIRIGVIGLGFVSQISHLKCIRSNKKIKIIALCDSNLKLLMKVSKKYKINNTYTSYKKMIKENNFDGIILSVNREKTSFIAEYLLKNKLNLLTEKPSALTSANAKNLKNLAAKNHSIYLTGYMKRHDYGVKKFKEKIQINKLGRLNNIYYEHLSGDSYGYQTGYFKSKNIKMIKKQTLNKKFLSKKKNYIKFLNTHCHSINLIRFLIGEFKLYKNLMNRFGEGYLIFKSKKIKIVLNNQYSKSKEWKENIKFYFENGTANLQLAKPFSGKSSSYTIIDFLNNKKQEFSQNKKWAFKEQIQYFTQLIELQKKKKHKKIYSEDSIKDINIIEKIFK